MMSFIKSCTTNLFCCKYDKEEEEKFETDLSQIACEKSLSNQTFDLDSTKLPCVSLGPQSTLMSQIRKSMVSNSLKKPKITQVKIDLSDLMPKTKNESFTFARRHEDDQSPTEINLMEKTTNNTTIVPLSQSNNRNKAKPTCETKLMHDNALQKCICRNISQNWKDSKYLSGQGNFVNNQTKAFEISMKNYQQSIGKSLTKQRLIFSIK